MNEQRGEELIFIQVILCRKNITEILIKVMLVDLNKSVTNKLRQSNFGGNK